MNKYKLILNFTLDDEKIIYFDKITRKKLKLMQKSTNYILFWRDKYFKLYLPFDYKISNELKLLYGNNSRYYSQDYKGVNNE